EREPCNRMCRHEAGRANQLPGLKFGECSGAESLQIDRVVSRAKIVDRVVLVSVGVGYRQVYETVWGIVGATVGATAIAAPKLVGTPSADNLIASKTAIDGVVPRASVDSVCPVVAKDGVIAGTPVDGLPRPTIA